MLSRAAQEIMEICSVDQTGCEDPDLDTDTTAHTLNSLEQELRLLAKGTDTHKQHIHKSCIHTHHHGMATYDQHFTLLIILITKQGCSDINPQ